MSRAKPAGLWRRLTLALAGAAVLAGVLRMLAGMLTDFGTYGFHDWDVATAYRYITVVSLRDYGVAPWWNPWLCGGFPAFGYIEGATNFLSPYLPVYLLADIRTAIRVEVIGATLTGAAGAFVLAGRFTRSIALRAFVAALFVLNGRWSLQLATGHTWHLQFCFMPWALYFFDRSQDEGRLFDAVYAACALALMALFGGIYPFPYTALLLAGYAVLLAAFRRSFRPLLALAMVGPLTAGLAAPKLLPVLDAMDRAPRLIDSREVIGLAELVVMLTDRSQRYGAFPVRVPAYNWHEWGIYIGVVPLACLVLGVLFGRGAREHALKILGLSCVLLGFGAFHPRAPWALLHELPVFSSLHVPSRFHLVMVLLLGLLFAAWAGSALDALIQRRPWIDLVALGLVALVVVDMTTVSQRPATQAFWMRAPSDIERAPLFEHRTKASVHYVERDWAEPVLLSMLANTGVVKCYGVPSSFRVGAIGADDPRYPGRAYVADGPGSAEIIRWNPNGAVVRVTGAEPGALVVYNMNFETSWRAAGAPALEHEHKVAARLPPGQDTIEFRYRPRFFWPACAIFLLTALLGFGPKLRRLAARRGAARRPPMDAPAPGGIAAR